MTAQNPYLPFPSEIREVIRHTKKEYTFRMTYDGEVRPGQFFEVSIPKYGEAPISVSGIADGLVDLTIRRVGRVTNEVFERYEGQTLLLRGPYGNGFDISLYEGEETVVVAGGRGVSPVRGVISALADMPDADRKYVIAGFRSPDDMLFRDDLKSSKTYQKYEVDEKINKAKTVVKDKTATIKDKAATLKEKAPWNKSADVEDEAIEGEDTADRDYVSIDAEEAAADAEAAVETAAEAVTEAASDAAEKAEDIIGKVEDAVTE